VKKHYFNQFCLNLRGVESNHRRKESNDKILHLHLTHSQMH
jgi:hypothetical protein